MNDIGINNDQIRLRGIAIEITQDEAKTHGIELSQHVLSLEEVERLREFANGNVAKSKKAEKVKSNDMFITLVAMDETIPSGTITPLKQVGLIPLTTTPSNPAMEMQQRLQGE